MSINVQQGQKKSQLEQKIKLLKDRPCPKLVNVFIGNEEYQYQVNDDTTIKKIIDRFVQNEFFNPNPQIIVQINGKKDEGLDKTIKKLLEEYKMVEKDKYLDIKLIDLKQLQNKKQIPIIQQQIKQTKQIKQLKKPQVDLNKQITISVKELKQVIKYVQNKKQCEQKYKQFYIVLKDKINTMNTNISNINMQKYIDISKLNNVLTQLIKKQKLQLPEQIGKQKALKQKLIQLYGQMNSIKTNNQFTKQIIDRFNNFDEQLMTQSFIAMERTQRTQKGQKSKKKTSYSQKYAGDQNNILKKVQKIMNIIRKDRVKIAALQRQQKDFKQTIYKLKQQIQSMNTNMFKKGKIYQQQNLSQATQIKRELRLHTYYINNIKYDTQVQNMINVIQKYQKFNINSFQSLLSIRGTQIQISFLAKYLDLGRLSVQNTRVLMLIELFVSQQQSKIITVYSTNGILKLINPTSQTKISQKTIQESIQKKCQYGNGFIFDITNKRIYQSTNQSPILTYNDKFIYISNCIELFDMNKKMNMKLGKQGSKKHLMDEKDDLSNIFGAKKKLDIIGMQLFKVNLNYGGNKSLQSTALKSYQMQKDYIDSQSTGEYSVIASSNFSKRKA